MFVRLSSERGIATAKSFVRPSVRDVFALCTSQHHGSTPRWTHWNFDRHRGGVSKKRLWAYKSSTISETRQGYYCHLYCHLFQKVRLGNTWLSLAACSIELKTPVARTLHGVYDKCDTNNNSGRFVTLVVVVVTHIGIQWTWYMNVHKNASCRKHIKSSARAVDNLEWIYFKVGHLKQWYFHNCNWNS